ncbi:sugar transferase [Acinetobacter sp. TWP2-2-3]|uniref:sugar transferase n=1 Tax=unclassified Acinetobacter TaxID=196816 RepID=UPI003CFA5C3E
MPQVHFYSFAYLFEGKEDVSKRLIDIVIALMALIILFPIFIIVAYKVQKNLGSPIFFYQERPGKNGKLFKMIKFRSMRNAIDKDGNPLPDKLRITSFGKKLRSTSLDEMPQLINVLKGDMSIVGPRPQMKEFLQHYTEEQMRRHEVKPGMTGLAQVSGRNNLSWEEKFELDVQYVERYNIWLDFKIMFKTAKVMLSQEGVNAPDQEVGAARFSKKSIHDTSLFTKEVK